MELFKILGTIAIDSADAIKALRDTQQEGEKTESKLGKVFSGLGKGAAVAGKAIATGLAAGAAAMAGLTAKALSASGELEQNLGGAEAVFGDLGNTISDMSTKVITGYDEATGKAITATRSLEQESKDAYKNMGLSQSDYLATANKMGALFKGAGFETQEALDMSSQAMQRAADVASIMGIDTSAAMDAVANAAKGNFTMMDNLGVAMNDTAIAAYAASKGINKSTSEMSQQEKIGLAMEMFLEKTSYAAGNYAKENETLAGSLSTAKAAFTNFLAGSGDVDSLVSSFSNLANVVVKSLTEIAPRLTQGISDLVQQVVPLIPPLLNTLLPVLVEGATTLINGLVAALPAVLSALMGILPSLISAVLNIVDGILAALPGIMQSICAALPSFLGSLIQGVTTLVIMLARSLPQIIQPIIDNLPAIITAVVDNLITTLPVLIQAAIQLILGLVAAMPQIIQALVDALPSVIAALVEGILGNLPMLIMGLIQVTAAIVAALPQILGSLISAVPAVLSGIWDGLVMLFAPLTDWFSEMWDSLGNVPGLSNMKTMIEQVWGAIKNFITTYIGAIKDIITTYWNAVKNVISTVLNAIKNVISTAWNAIKTIISNVMKLISSVLKGDWEGVKSAISNILNAIKSVITSVWDGIKSIISSVLDGIKSIVSSVWNGIKSIVSSQLNVVKTVVSSVWNGIKGTISSVLNGIKTTVTKGFNDVKSKITGAFKDLPSKLKSIGGDLIAGLWNGINDKFGWLTSKIKGFANNVTDKLKSFFGIHSPSIVMRDEVGKQLAAGVAEGILAASGDAEGAAEDMASKVVETAEKKLEEYKRYNDFTLADEVAFWDEIRNLTKEGSEERLEVDKKYLSAKASMDEQLIEAEKKLQETLKSTQEKLADSFGLFGEVEFDEWMFGSKMLDNLSDQTLALEKYEVELKKLKDKIGDGDLFKELAAMGVKALPNITSINSMTDAQLEELVNQYAKRAEVAGRVAAETAGAEYKETMAAIGFEIENIDNQPVKEFATSASQMITGFFETVVSTIESEVEKLEAALAAKDGTSLPSSVAELRQTENRKAALDSYEKKNFLTVEEKEALVGKTKHQIRIEEGDTAYIRFITQDDQEFNEVIRALTQSGGDVRVADRYNHNGEYMGREVEVTSNGETVYLKKQDENNNLMGNVYDKYARDKTDESYARMRVDISEGASVIGEKLDLLDPSSHQYTVGLSETDSAKISKITELLDKMSETLSEYFPQVLANMLRELRLDTGVLVGELAPAMNEELGRISSRKDRGL